MPTKLQVKDKMATIALLPSKPYVSHRCEPLLPLRRAPSIPTAPLRILGGHTTFSCLRRNTTPGVVHHNLSGQLSCSLTDVAVIPDGLCESIHPL